MDMEGKENKSNQLNSPVPQPKSKKVSNIINWLIAFISSTIAMITLFLVFFKFDESQQRVYIKASKLHFELEILEEAIDTQNQKISSIEKQMSEVIDLPQDSKVSLQFSELQKKISNLKLDISKLNEVILDNPQKALSVPLLKKDLDNLSQIYKNDLISIRQEISLIYDLNKWLIGLMFSMAVGLLGLAVINLFQSRKKES